MLRGKMVEEGRKQDREEGGRQRYLYRQRGNNRGIDKE